MTYDEAMETGKLVRLPLWSRDLSVISGSDGLRLYSEGKYIGYIGNVSAKERALNDWRLWTGQENQESRRK